ncbi:hypothetical protein ACU3L3_02440 [Priestia endophytica]|uniref:hypothetical protein n=1 Tax=Priestia endophytica TaxID=135735 RepID=UPI0018CD2F7B|nr:hypothetical protein [Priestia endophytica]
MKLKKKKQNKRKKEIAETAFDVLVEVPEPLYYVPRLLWIGCKTILKAISHA